MDSGKTVAARDLVYEPQTEAGEWIMVVAREGVPTVDGRIFDKDALTWREPPIPLLMIRENDPTGAGGHKGAFAAGTITDLWREEGEDGNATIYGRGYFAADDKGQEARNLVKEGVISGVSADVGGAVVEELEAAAENELRRVIKRGTIVSVTALPIPAFNETKIAVVAAAGAEWAPPSEWFQRPSFDGPTPITVTEDGRVYGHAAVWGTCHVGHQAKCVTPPRSKANYQFFNVGQVHTADGKTVNVGRLTAGTNHANITFGAQPAAEHYDNTGWAGAYVHAGEDEHGIWFAGAVSPTATPEQIAVLRAASVSGDWRNINGALEMVGLLAVNSPGFPVARAGMVAGAQMSLVAAGTIQIEDVPSDDCGCDEPAEDASEEFAIVDDAVAGSAKDGLIKSMKTLLANTVSVSHEAHGFHWNVKGSDFAQYHELFGNIYEDLHGSVDPIAESILKVGYDAPFHLSQFMEFADIPEVMAIDTPDSMARALLGQVNKLIDCLNTCFSAATAVNEQGIANLIAERIDANQKWAWQLRSSVGLQTGDPAPVVVVADASEESAAPVPVVELELLDLDVLVKI